MTIIAALESYHRQEPFKKPQENCKHRRWSLRHLRAYKIRENPETPVSGKMTTTAQYDD